MITPEDIYGEIRRESLAPNSTIDHPLPLIGSWNASTFWNYGGADAGYYMSWQLDQVAQEGRHMLPWLEIPVPTFDASYGPYYEAPLKRAAQLGLPISFVGTEWEHYLSEEAAYLNLPESENPNAIALDGSFLRSWLTNEVQVAPFGALEPWYEVGYRWGSSEMMQQVQRWYPDPPLVIFVSNNEHSRLYWTQAESEKRYVEQYGMGTSDDLKRQVIGDGFTVRYRELIRGFRDGLSSQAWKDRSVFIAYQAFAPWYMGRWYGWKRYGLPIPGRIDPNPLRWEGGVSEYYLWPGSGSWDNNVEGPGVGTMNLVFALDEAYQLNPSFWFELITWDQDQTGRNWYEQHGQSFTPERYGGYAQFGMWLLRPRLVRTYRHWDQSRQAILPWDTPIFDAVDRVYQDDTLRSFWRNSTLVHNNSREHPYQYDFPPEYADRERMFLLNTNLDPALPWSMNTEFPVMALARVQGADFERRWLLYAYAPLGDAHDVEITVPGYGNVVVDVALGGSFYLIDEPIGNVCSLPLEP